MIRQKALPKWEGKGKDPAKVQQHYQTRMHKQNTIGHEVFFKKRLAILKNRNKYKYKKEFNITWQDLKEIFPKDNRCPIFKTPFVTGKEKYPRKLWPSVDRIDNNKGYTKGNIIWVSNGANSMKGEFTADEIIKVGKFYKELEKNVKV